MLNTLNKKITDLIGSEGLLAKNWDAYEARPGQLSMSLEVARAFVENDFAIIEAGTGTGKTLAYLLPALLSGKRSIVSTGLKNLQDQIFEKDIPFIRKYIGSNFKAARLKGRENYLCLYFLHKLSAQKSFLEDEYQKILEKIVAWAAESSSGDKAELSILEGQNDLWNQLSAPAERCLGKKCTVFNSCFLWKARREAEAADLVVVNHHLFMADLSIRGKGYGEVIPKWEAAIFDESHLLEEAATNYFGHNISSATLNYLKNDLKNIIPYLTTTGKEKINSFWQILQNRITALLTNFYPKVTEFELWQTSDQQAEAFKTFLQSFALDLSSLGDSLNSFKHLNDEIELLAKRAERAAATLIFIAEASDDGYLYQIHRQGRYMELLASPIDVSKQLKEKLLELGKTLVFTSATLTSAGSFKYFKERLGLGPELEGLTVSSPFDYKKQTILYIPKNFPAPDQQNHSKAFLETLEELINLSKGRALVLFTSYKQMHFAAESLKIKWPILIQGQKPRVRLLEDFTADIHSVLLATHSFWQGVDVSGESLSAVIIDKLPFPRPNRPLVKARSERLLSQKRNPFMEYYIPETIITLNQGLGRLIRSKTDQGLLAILDSRISTKSYGSIIKKSLPKTPIVDDLAKVAAFMAKF